MQNREICLLSCRITFLPEICDAIISLRTVEKTVAGRIQNLTPWPKGISGNPAGRPKNDISVEIARAVFENNPEAIYRGMARRLMKGDTRAFKVLADRAYGKVKEQVDVDLSHRIVQQLQAGRRRVLEGLSEAELKDRIEKLQTELERRVEEEFEGGLGSRMPATRQ
jgi:hypothetical protein